MTEPCPFCLIVRDKAPATAILRHGGDTRFGGDVFEFEPLNPVTDGHRLFVPYQHVLDATDDPAITGYVMNLAVRVARKRGGPFNLITSVGVEATQSVFHLHVHYVPRRPGDGLLLPWGGQKGDAGGDVQ